MPQRLRLLVLTVALIGLMYPCAANASEPGSWQVPSDGGTVSGKLDESSGNCVLAVAAGTLVDHIDFFLDGALLNIERYAPYSCVWDTATAVNGWHVLKAVGFDTLGRSASVSINVMVANPVAAPPPPPPPPTSGTVSCDRYASPSGSNTGRGTVEDPYRTVATLRDSLSAGQTGCLRGGTYGSTTSWTEFNRGGASGSPITFISYPGERATLVGGYTVNADYVTLSHLTFDLNFLRPRTSHPSCDSQAALPLDIYSSHDTLEYNDIGQQDMSPYQRDNGIGVWATSSGARTSNIVIRYNKIHDYGSCSAYDHGIYFDHSAYGQIYGNWIYNPACSYGEGGGDHTRGCGAGIQLYVDPIATEVHGNVIDGTGLGFYIAGSGGKVYNNVITNSRGLYQSGVLRPAAAFSGYGGSNNAFTDNAMFNTGPMCFDCNGIVSATGDLMVDPQYTDPANGNYALKSSSPIPSSWDIWDGTG